MELWGSVDSKRLVIGIVYGGWAKWLTVSTIVIGSISYMGYLVTPDWREIVDSKHYYSNWKLSSHDWQANALIDVSEITCDD
ncbi:hypothetical protein NECAME_17242 [Necator americanus]|uniref:Uncharacterized protein n=1 Tax=Necator americanus TaxID=51031 RepID=W2TQQ4_NECAM|nr:hypothetical protein NECAME_17242 [Necator americanus]ETN84123.1 hypothetical protein NECAME_17242 [Necator americanus]